MTPAHIRSQVSLCPVGKHRVPSPMLEASSTFLENAKLFSKVVLPIYIPVTNPYPYLLFSKIFVNLEGERCYFCD